MIKIGLLTNSVISANYGVNALSLSNILLIEQTCKDLNIKHKYIIFGDVSEIKRQLRIVKHVDGLKEIEIDIVPELEFRKINSIISFGKNIKKCDIIFDTSGGDSYSDIYGNTRMLHQFVPKCIALLLRKRLVLTPQTIGPFKNPIWKKLCKVQLRKCVSVFARDNKSYLLGKDDFKLTNIYEVTDMAMVLPYKAQEKSNKPHFQIGLNVSGLLYNGGYTGDNQFGLKVNYTTLIDDLVEMLTNELACDVYLVPHVITTGSESDNEVCEELKEKFPKLNYDGIFDGPIEAKSFISTMDLFIGSRMHSTIAAISSGVPVIPLSYSRKFEGLFESIGYEECINLRELDESIILELVRKDVKEIEKLSVSVQNADEIINRKINLYKKNLKDVLGKCVK